MSRRGVQADRDTEAMRRYVAGGALDNRATPEQHEAFRCALIKLFAENSIGRQSISRERSLYYASHGLSSQGVNALRSNDPAYETAESLFKLIFT